MHLVGMLVVDGSSPGVQAAHQTSCPQFSRVESEDLGDGGSFVGSDDGSNGRHGGESSREVHGGG